MITAPLLLARMGSGRSEEGVVEELLEGPTLQLIYHGKGQSLRALLGLTIFTRLSSNRNRNLFSPECSQLQLRARLLSPQSGLGTHEQLVEGALGGVAVPVAEGTDALTGEE